MLYKCTIGDTGRIIHNVGMLHDLATPFVPKYIYEMSTVCSYYCFITVVYHC